MMKIFSTNDQVQFCFQLLFSFLSRSINVFSSFFLIWLIPSKVGLEGLGVYVTSFSLVLGIGTISRCGLVTGLVRWAGHDFALGNKDKAANYILQGASWTFTLSVIFSLTAIAASSLFQFSQIGATSGPLSFILFISAAPLHATSSILSTWFKITDRAYLSPFVESSGVTLLMLFFVEVYGLLGNGISINSYAISYFVSNVLILLISLIVFIKENYFRLGRELGSSLVFWNKNDVWKQGMWDYAIVDIINYSFQYGIIVFLSFMIPISDVGVFSVLMRVSLILNFILLVFNTITAPRFSKFYSMNKTSQLIRLAQNSSFYMCIILLIILPFIIVFTEELLGFFSEVAITHKNGFYILLFSQTLNVLTGSSGPVLNMTGNQHVMRDIVIFSSLLALGIMYFLVGALGILGACISISSGISVRNLLSFFMIKRRLNFYLLPKLHLNSDDKITNL